MAIRVGARGVQPSSPGPTPGARHHVRVDPRCVSPPGPRLRPATVPGRFLGTDRDPGPGAPMWLAAEKEPLRGEAATTRRTREMIPRYTAALVGRAVEYARTGSLQSPFVHSGLPSLWSLPAYHAEELQRESDRVRGAS